MISTLYQYTDSMKQAICDYRDSKEGFGIKITKDQVLNKLSLIKAQAYYNTDLSTQGYEIVTDLYTCYVKALQNEKD